MSDQHFIKVGCFEWVDVPTPQGPDMQVRLSRVAEPVIAVLEWRVRPDINDLDAQGVTREESNRWPGDSMTAPREIDEQAQAVLAAHLLQGPRTGQCRCGWGDGCDNSTLGRAHSEHVAERLRAAGLLR